MVDAGSLDGFGGSLMVGMERGGRCGSSGPLLMKIGIMLQLFCEGDSSNCGGFILVQWAFAVDGLSLTASIEKRSFSLVSVDEGGRHLDRVD